MLFRNGGEGGARNIGGVNGGLVGTSYYSIHNGGTLRWQQNVCLDVVVKGFYLDDGRLVDRGGTRIHHLAVTLGAVIGKLIGGYFCSFGVSFGGGGECKGSATELYCRGGCSMPQNALMMM